MVPVRWLKQIIAVFLMPLAYVLTRAFFSSFSRVTLNHAFWASEEFWFFALGAILWFITFFGLLVMGVGTFGIVTMRFLVGFRGMQLTIIEGIIARRVAMGYFLGGLITALASFISWTNLTSIPRQQLLIVCGIGLTIVFVAHLAGTINAEFSKRE